MHQQRHTINRHILELYTSDVRQAQKLQNEFAEVHRRLLIPLLEAFFDQSIRPDQLIRVETLTQDLGTLNRDGLEEKLVQHLTTELQRQFRTNDIEAIQRVDEDIELPIEALQENDISSRKSTAISNKPERTSSQLELLVWFMQTGHLPWWADTSVREPVDEALNTSLRQCPAELLKILARLPAKSGVWIRIIGNCSDTTLARLTAVLAHIPHSQQLSGLLLNVLNCLHGNFPTQRNRIRTLFWTRLLTDQGRQKGMQTVTLLVASVLIAISKETKCDVQTLVGLLRASSTSDSALGAAPKSILDSILGYFEGLEPVAAAPDDAVPDGNSLKTQALTIIAALERRGKSWELLAVQLRPAVARLDADETTEVLAALQHLARQPDDLPTVARRVGQHVGEWPDVLREMLRTVLRNVEQSANATGEVEGHAAEQSPHAELEPSYSASAESPHDVPPFNLDGVVEAAQSDSGVAADEPDLLITEPDVSFSKIEAIYVEEAGLVLLAPFLSHFFNHMGLLEEQSFANTAARHRAVGMLLFLAHQEFEPREYRSPLCKILCGMDIIELLEFGESVSDEEATECQRLLSAVIAQAPILNDMSLDGFRRTFLQRQAKLSSRDGSWLLQVERATFDIVLERLPWTFQWIRLPWMNLPLQVEWI